ncbi:EAL domain-containing protein [Legionella bononiensis]|uniref:EAL domain-containing protein n=1 Tax=Legionella bononiensis TaxID=2793102 RepID=A0ABS1WD65_9GAMM|nr:EAL domain-containing protein [Legionella bononiensis]MBL7479072.1 EAL domain-containing protein [Legionella bononiensis]MBL7527205.1 EAL domain-containing protein [Legionella bononiensis]MBL7562174.1 EAL domain-containing protein [Legionella bononiensis]
MTDVELHIMIIDDNPAIHQDFIKVLTSTTLVEEVSDLDKQLFDDDLPDLSDPKLFNSLPKFIFETAYQGKEGVEKIRKSLLEGLHYSLAFVDVQMPPGWDGIETIKHMWKVDPDIQVVICTAYSDYTWEETVKELGIGDNYLILKKPFDLVSVRQLACALTRKWTLAQAAKRTTELLQNTIEQRTESLQQSLSLLRSTIESSADGILVVDLNRKIIDYNSKFQQIWNIPQSMLDSKDGELVSEYMLNQVLKANNYLAQINHLEKAIDEVSRNIVYLKNDKIMECYSQPHRLNNITIGRVWSFRDITERANLEKKLEYQASHDMLTGLPNRSLLTDRIQHLIEYSQRNSKRFAVLFFDLDRFKLINDSLSHEAGDNLLKMVAKRWEHLLRKEDTIARIGGDEFVMIVRDCSTDQSVITVVDKIIQSLNEPFKLGKRDVTISTTIGISIYPKDGTSVNTLIKSADLAMYLAKERGGNQFQFYNEELNDHADKTLKLEIELRQALVKNEFKVYYQPQFDMENRCLLSAEALIRWQHPQKGMLLPIDFIPAAEISGLIVPIGEWVIDQVCQQIKKWHEKGLPWTRIAVNVATQQLKQVNFHTVVKEILDKYQIDPQYLELEITENVVITNVNIIRMINQLKDIGVKIVLDDFGTGNSSLNYLKHLNIDRLKIDQSYIKNITSSRSDEVIIEAIIAMARSFNFKVVAEGVETTSQLNYLKMQNCDEVQGFLFSKPITAKALEKFLK